MSKRIKIWYAWICVPDGYKGMIKINSYDKVAATCNITLSGGITSEVPMDWIHACYDCILPWEEEND